MKNHIITFKGEELKTGDLIIPDNSKKLKEMAEKMNQQSKLIAKEISDKVEKVLKACLIKTGNDLSEETAKRVTKANFEDKLNYSEYFLDKGTDKEILLMTHQINFETKDGIPSVSQEFGAIVEVEK
jgi:hypothetical protein